MKVKSNQLIISLVIFLIWVVILVIAPDLLIKKGPETLDSSVAQDVSIPLILAPVFLLIAVAVLGWWREVGIKKVGSSRSLLITWFPLLFILGFITITIIVGLPANSTITIVLVNTILVGISEELMFRGFMLYGALTKFKIWTAIIFTTLIFGSVHFLNGFTTGDFKEAAIQAVTAAMAGIWFTAIRFRTKSIIPGMVIHGLWDGALTVMTLSMRSMIAQSPDSSTVSTPFAALLLPILFDLPLFLYSLWLMRGIGEEDRSDLLGYSLANNRILEDAN